MSGARGLLRPAALGHTAPMRTLLWSGALFALLWIGIPSPATAATTPDSVTTILVVRHAEKDTTMLGSDPRLSAAGVVRSHELAQVLSEARVSAIYVTPWQRNRQTAQPLATRNRDTLIVVDAIDETVSRLRTRHRGQTVLVVGHSNTVPQIIEQLTGEKVRPFVENDYDRLYVVTLPPSGPGRLLALRYGAHRP